MPIIHAQLNTLTDTLKSSSNNVGLVLMEYTGFSSSLVMYLCGDKIPMIMKHKLCNFINFQACRIPQVSFSSCSSKPLWSQCSMIQSICFWRVISAHEHKLNKNVFANHFPFNWRREVCNQSKLDLCCLGVIYHVLTPCGLVMAWCLINLSHQ